MTLDDLTQTIAWLAPEERRAAADLIQSFQQHFAERQIPVTPILVLRIRDYLRHHFLSDRVERDLIPDPTQESRVPSLSTINCQLSTASPPASSAVDHRLAEQVGRTQARQRRSLKDLEITINLLDPTSPYRRSAARALAKSQAAATNEAPAQAVPGDPRNDPKFIQNLIEEVGIDLNDPDFFDDDLVYDLSDPDIMERVKQCPAAFPHHIIERFAPFVPEAAARLRAVGYTPAEISQRCKTPNNTPQASSHPPETPRLPITAQERAQSTSPIAQPSINEAQIPDEEPHPSHESHEPHPSHDPRPSTASHPSHPSHTSQPDPESPAPQAQTPESDFPGPKTPDPGPSPKPSPKPSPWRSPIPPTPPPVVEYYKVKPTPFNQRQFKKSSPT